MSGQENRNFNQYQGGDRRVTPQSTGQGPGWDVTQHRAAMDRDMAAARYNQWLREQQSQGAGASVYAEGSTGQSNEVAERVNIVNHAINEYNKERAISNEELRQEWGT